MMLALTHAIFPLAGAVALAAIITTTADYWKQACAALSAFSEGE